MADQMKQEEKLVEEEPTTSPVEIIEQDGLTVYNVSKDKSELDSRTIPYQDEPLPSGYGVVSKDASEEQLAPWLHVILDFKELMAVAGDDQGAIAEGHGDLTKDTNDLNGQKQYAKTKKSSVKSKQKSKQRPEHLSDLVKKGIPEALRGEVWQLLASTFDGGPQDKNAPPFLASSDQLMSAYATLVATHTSACKEQEQAVQRDVSRTFPGHPFFRSRSSSSSTSSINSCSKDSVVTSSTLSMSSNSSQGQEALFRVCKAYALYDTTVSYCQGLSFVAAALLLHMPEEQAFVVLVNIMARYGQRNLFLNSFADLHKCFFQLDRFLEDCLPDLFEHFVHLGVEAHMYASQWFLTLFTAKFPLCFVYYILDVYLLEGQPVMFAVALSLLQLSKSELISSDFEGILKHFRVHLPKKYWTEEGARTLLGMANSKLPMVKKRISDYEREYRAMQEEDKLQSQALARLQADNKRLIYSNLRLERDNDDLARELISSQINWRQGMDVLEDKVDVLTKELLVTKGDFVELEEEKTRLNEEVGQLKEVLRREVEKSERELHRNNKIISDYKGICSQLSKRLENEEKRNANLVLQVNKVKKQRAPQTSRQVIEEAVEGIDGDNDGQQAELVNVNLKATFKESTINGNLGNDFQDVSSEGVTSDSNQEDEDYLNHASNLTNDDDDSSNNYKALRELELELAQTKLALVEAECVNQDLNHELGEVRSELDSIKRTKQNTWYKKTLTSVNISMERLRGSNSGSSSSAVAGTLVAGGRTSPSSTSSGTSTATTPTSVTPLSTSGSCGPLTAALISTSGHQQHVATRRVSAAATLSSSSSGGSSNVVASPPFAPSPKSVQSRNDNDLCTVDDGKGKQRTKNDVKQLI